MLTSYRLRRKHPGEVTGRGQGVITPEETLNKPCMGFIRTNIPMASLLSGRRPHPRAAPWAWAQWTQQLTGAVNSSLAPCLPPVFPGITPQLQRNHMHLNLCLRIYFEGDPNKIVDVPLVAPRGSRAYLLRPAMEEEVYFWRASNFICRTFFSPGGLEPQGAG